jgi:hypothetical protein
MAESSGQFISANHDGTIIGRMGATGQNLPGDELEPHAHNAIWRIDIDFGGAAKNTYNILKIRETLQEKQATARL